jgi:chromosome segregation ATPase
VQVLHVGIVIHVVNREQSLWVYKDTCEKEVVPQFLTELKEEDEDVAKEMAEKIIVHIHQPTDTIWIYVRDGLQNKWADYERKLAETAVRRFNALDQAKRVQLMAQLTKEKNDLEAKVRESEEKLRGLERYVADTKAQSSLLWQELSSMKSELTQSELKKAELETKLNLLARKAAEVKDTVSSEQIAALERTAQQLEMQIGEQSGEDAINRHKIVLKQKEEEFSRIAALRERAVISEAEVQKARYELELAKADYERAQRMMVDVRNRLEKVRADLKKAKEEFAQTGGLALATVIAEKTLECESELASVEGKTRILAKRIAETQQRIDDGRSLDRELEEEKGRCDELKGELAVLTQREKELDDRIRTGVRISKSPKDCYKVGGYSDIGEEEPGTFEVVGEVKKPGTFKVGRRTTLLQAIAAAGGVTKNGDAKNVVILCATKKAAPAAATPESWDVRRRVVDLMAIMKGEAPDDLIIEPDDTVIVPRKESAE